MKNKALNNSCLSTAYKPHVYPTWPTRFLYREFPLPSHLKHPAQSLLFTLFVEMSYAQEINLRDLCEYVECQYIDLVAMAEELEVLLERQLIRKREAATPSYRVPGQVLNAVKQGQGFTPAPLKGLSIDEFFKQADAQFFSRRSRELSSKELVRILQILIEGNRHLSF